MDEPTPEQIAKLPKWAQEHIRHLRRERDEARRKADVLENTQERSRIWWEESYGGDTNVFLPDSRYSSVYFDLTAEGCYDAAKNRRFTEGAVRVHRGHTFYSNGTPEDVDTSLTLRCNDGRLSVTGKGPTEIVLRHHSRWDDK
ncbi:hypothetical protein Mbo2_082 [Rhodococcus phage Mbo2]|uniref:Uncharacterized protein n=1 Tax=Rhodococcus phage Mbo2 TaxID=2936911 RepID=A0A9E7ISF0_9CAUD|nr:hypothetical protein Mbo2_082 [Rhodococcus phage Mbo2]